MLTANEKFIDSIVSATMKAVADIKPDNRVMTYAHDEKGCRNSFTAKIYKSKKGLNFIRAEVDQIACFFNIEQKLVNRFFENSGGAKLGHIAGGMNTMNDPFFTIYFDDLYDVLKKDNV